MYIYEWRQLLWYFVVSVLACAVCFVLTCMFSIPKEVLEQDSGDCSADCNAAVFERGWEEGHGGRSEEKESVGKENTAGREFWLRSPLAGRAVSMKEVPDAIFAAEALGKGMAVIPEEGEVVAPCQAEVTALFDTKHAIRLKRESGVELLIHVGVNTVELEGKYYKVYVSQGDKVKAGQLLLTFDMEKIKEAGYEVITPVIVSNTEEYWHVEGREVGNVKCMEDLIKVLGGR